MVRAEFGQSMGGYGTEAQDEAQGGSAFQDKIVDIAVSPRLNFWHF